MTLNYSTMLHIKTSFDSLPNFDECEQTLVGNDFDVYKPRQNHVLVL